ncbi:MAG: type II secretion system protein [Sulfurovum sp.]|nr:type II secretion system protein [Sulfurovum sp.]
MNKKAFTMIELVLAVVVIGILAALALPRLERDLRQEAADNILSAVRYTQHLALADNKHEFNSNQWQMKYWHLRFGSYGGNIAFYTISSNEDMNTNVDKIETAVDPANGKYFYHLAGDSTLDEVDESPNIFIRKRYGTENITFGGGCSGGQLIAFDRLGRPHTGIYSGANDFRTYMNAACRITVSFQDPDFLPFTIVIEPETGYSYIEGQDNS